ncbi:ABC transporter permease [Variovorax arabinosiphilus]|uniref:ABC transporter permease n=1 Tax=Variovorax arabinosiphilus TaxID=3053498 RepID=UPI00257900A9|nr:MULTISPECIES: ABC transporter permease [unclassified Variovorax]MDM0118420.1 ABC transporter permease [Variovorax sp. J2L1-78]MDM0128845.1 ABC transporter permease [Variovorax sp. J2L1-63]MDM0233369.1 ABC transporter permease [Variovorax sp. J2R1-6]
MKTSTGTTLSALAKRPPPAVAAATPVRFVRARRPWRAWSEWPLSLRIGTVLLGIQLIVALAAGWLYPGDPFDLAGAPFVRPFEDPQFPLGTDIMGRDIAAGLMHGARVSLLVGLSATLIATVLGTAIGLLAGYFGGWLDHLLMRFTELFQVIPHFLFAIILVSIMGSKLQNIVLAIGVTSWTMVARLVRAETLALRERDYVKICAVMGGSRTRVILTHILPNAFAPVIVAASILTALAVLTEAGLAFLGMSDSNRVSWGGMIGASREALLDAPYMTLIPGAAIVFAVMALSLIGDGLTQHLRRDVRA